MTSDQVAAETQAPQSWPESGNPADETTGQSGPGPRPAATCPGPLRGARHGDLESTRISWDPVTRRPHGVRAPCTGRERGLGNGGRNGLADTPGPELTSHCPGFPLPSAVCTQKGELSPGGLDSIQGQGEAPGPRSRLPLTHWINRPTVPGKEDENHATCFVVVLPGDGERGGWRGPWAELPPDSRGPAAPRGTRTRPALRVGRLPDTAPAQAGGARADVPASGSARGDFLRKRQGDRDLKSPAWSRLGPGPPAAPTRGRGAGQGRPRRPRGLQGCGLCCPVADTRGKRGSGAAGPPAAASAQAPPGPQGPSGRPEALPTRGHGHRARTQAAFPASPTLSGASEEFS